MSNVMAEKRQLAELGPELDFASAASILQGVEDVRGKVSRWIKSGELVGIVRGIYVTAPELRKRPVSLEVLANMIFGPSYVSFEYALSRSGLIPEATRAVTSATPKRNKDFDTPLGRFSYRHLPLKAYAFGYTREELSDGSGFLVARPEKALLDWLYLSGAVRSVKAMESRLYEDLRLEPEALGELDRDRLVDYAGRMPGESFRVHFAKLLERAHA
jgi:predicted transcriptional regulator of viral defense system